MTTLHFLEMFSLSHLAVFVLVKTVFFFTNVMKGELNSTSTYVPAQLTKVKVLLHYTLTKIDVKMDKCELPTGYQRYAKLHINPTSYQILATVLLPFFQSILHPP